MDLKLGTITHYYDKIGVAIIDLEADLSQGDEIIIKSKDKEFKQKVSSIQFEHEPVSQAKKGQSIGLKVAEPVKAKAQVFKVN